MLKEIKDYLHEINARKESIVAGSFNQETCGDKTQQFYCEIGVQDVLSGHEGIPYDDIDVKFKRGSRCIDSIAVSEGIMPFVEGFEVIDWDENILKDHRGHAIELNL